MKILTQRTQRLTQRTPFKNREKGRKENQIPREIHWSFLLSFFPIPWKTGESWLTDILEISVSISVFSVLKFPRFTFLGDVFRVSVFSKIMFLRTLCLHELLIGLSGTATPFHQDRVISPPHRALVRRVYESAFPPLPHPWIRRI